jgi:hypothetical protein
MKKVIWLAALLAVGGSPVLGTSYLGSVINSWDGKYTQGSSTSYPLSITYGDGYIWLGYSAFITKRIPATGSIVDLIGFSDRYGSDMGFENSTKYLYCACSSYGVYVRDSASGSLVRSFSLPPGATSASGIDFDEGAPSAPVILGDSTAWRIFNLTGTGSLVNSISTGLGSVGGLAMDRNTSGGPYLFAGTRTSPPRVYALNPASGSVLYSFQAPVANQALRGLAWDGTYLWTADNVYGSPTVGMVFQFIAHDTNVNVAPTSLGKVKSLFR